MMISLPCNRQLLERELAAHLYAAQPAAVTLQKMEALLKQHVATIGRDTARRQYCSAVHCKSNNVSPSELMRTWRFLSD
jgi:alkylhydroperoxidase family enzyme